MPFIQRTETAFRVIEKSYYKGINDRINEHNELIRIPIFIKGEPNTGKTYTIKKIELSPIGLHIKLTAPAPPYNDFMRDFTVSIKLKDGSTVPINDSGSGYSSAGNNKPVKGHYSAIFDTPISLEDVETLIICDTTFPLPTN